VLCVDLHKPFYTGLCKISAMVSLYLYYINLAYV
jgi:hypothetical protein